MSRRRGLSYWLMAPVRGLSEVFRLLVLVPYYETLRFLGQLGRSFVGGTGSKSFGGVFLYYLLWLPLTLWYLCVSLGRSALAALGTWPEKMRLRDLATGLPALIVAIPVVISLTMFRKDRNELTKMYQKGMVDSAVAAAKTKDAKEQKDEFEQSLFYARSLARIDPEEPMFRFNLALLYLKSGDNARGLTMISELAPYQELKNGDLQLSGEETSPAGFAPAHLWMAKQVMLKRPLDFRRLYSHLNSALAGDKVDRNEIHKLLGDLYYTNYMLTTQLGKNPLNYDKDYSLRRAGEHFDAYIKGKGDDIRVAYAYGKVLLLQKNYATQQLIMEDVLKTMAAKSRLNANDVVARIEYATALTVSRNFREAVNVIQEGRNRTPDPRLEQFLSQIYFQYAEFNRQSLPNAISLSYDELQKAFELDPNNASVAAGYLKGICGKRDDEKAAIRKSLDSVPPAIRNRAMTKFLVGFDADRRNLPQLSRPLYAEAAKANDPDTPSAIAEAVFFVFDNRVGEISKEDARKINDKALELWPTHPDLLFVRAFDFLQTHQYANAQVLLEKAVDAKKKNVKLNLRIAQDLLLYGDLATACRKQGIFNKADEYSRLAESAMAKREQLETLK